MKGLRHSNPVHAPNKRTRKYVRQSLIEMEGERGKFIVTVGDLNISLSTIEKLDNQ